MKLLLSQLGMQKSYLDYNFDCRLRIKKAHHFRDRLCREEGIRTPDTLPYTRFPSVLLKPLGHLSLRIANVK